MSGPRGIRPLAVFRDAMFVLDEGHDHAAQGLDFLVGELRTIKHGARGADHRAAFFGRIQESARRELALEMLEQLEHFLAGRLPVNWPVLDARRRREVTYPEPLVRQQQNGLPQIERREFRRWH